MSDLLPEVVSFRTHSDFKIAIGTLNDPVIVPRMSFITGGKVISLIAQMQSKDLTSAMSLLIDVKNGKQVQGSGFEKAVSDLIKGKNFDCIIQLLDLVSEGVVTEKLIDEANAQFSEVAQLLAHLIDGNFASLKNLSASLQAITVNGR